MTSVKRALPHSESLRFLIALAAGHVVSNVPNDPGLAALAIEHRMQGLVMSVLESQEDAESKQLRKQLASIDGRTWARHRFLATELARVNSKLTARGVRHYLIKGLAFESRFYDRTGERPSGDLDVVLADPSSIATALEVLEGNSRDPHVVQQLVDEGWIQSVDVTLPSGAVVDLHVDPLKLGFQSRLASSAGRHLASVTVGETDVATLNPTASLVVALIHLNRNRFRHLSGFADVVRILARSEIDWGVFDELVQGDGLEVLIDGSLNAVSEELDLDRGMFGGWWVPRTTLGYGLRRKVWSLAWRPSSRLTGTAGRFRMGRRSQFLMPALCRGRLGWVLKWMTRRLFPPRPVLELNHPDISGPYLVRLVRGRWHQVRHTRLHRTGTRERESAEDGLSEPAG